MNEAGELRENGTVLTGTAESWSDIGSQNSDLCR